jgi:hypothetical protein
MRITVGGVLLVLGVGSAGAWYVMSPGAPSNVSSTGSSGGGIIQGLQEKINTSLGLFQSASSTATPEPLQASAQTPAPEATPETLPESAAPVEVPSPVAVVEEAPKPAPVVRKRRTRAPRVKKAVRKSSRKAAAPVVAAKAPAAAAPAQAPAKPAAKKGSLVGSYVVLTLATGREVKGILQEQTPASYKVELPGLGAFTYPAQNVKDVRAAE